MVPERHNTVKVLLFLDIGGSMDDHVRLTEELFSAARTEFKHLEYYYFHNFPYERVWKNNRRRFEELIPTWQVLRTYGPDYKLIIVGDAAMSPYEITMPGGSVEHFNEEAGTVWLDRLSAHYRRARLAEPDAETKLGPCAVDHHGQRPDGRPDVPADGQRDRRDDAGIEPVVQDDTRITAGSGERLLVVRSQRLVPERWVNRPTKSKAGGLNLTVLSVRFDPLATRVIAE